MKFIAIALVLATLAVASAAPLSENQYQFLFTKWVDQFDRQYEAKQFFVKYDTFKSNMNRVLEHNQKGLNYTMAMNQFGDLTAQEFKAKYASGFRNVDNSYLRSKNVASASHTHIQADAEVDWRKDGAVTPVKNQGQCGSCWAFSATGALEGAWAVAKKELVSLSEQQLVDCAGAKFDNHGCSGGLMDNAFQFVISNKGITTEDAYPYTAKDDKCKPGSKAAVTISSFVDVKAGSEADLLKAVALGPVAVAIEADQSGFQFYSSGVFDGTCGQDLDHGVLAVGYGTENGKDFWIVKNSWGASWGDKGYIKIRRNFKNLCGIASMASYPVV